MTACNRAQQWATALRLFHRVTVDTDIVCFGAALVAWGNGRHWTQALHAFESMNKGDRECNQITCNVLLDVFAKAYCWEHALDLFSSMC